jgi:O-antigen/teichoic acid export membrane protein
MSGNKLGRSRGSFEYSTVLRYSYPLGIAATITIVAASADLVVVAGYLNAESLGVYNAAVTISTLLSTVFVLPLMTAFLPELSRSNEESISRGVRLAFRFLTLVVLPASLLVASIPKQLIDLFTGGGAYLAGSSSLELIAFSYLFLAIQMILGVLFQATGRTVYAMIIGLTSAASDIGVSILLVPHLGLLGAASAKVSVALVGASVGIYLAKRYMRMLDRASFYFKGLVASVIPFLVTFLLSSYVSVRVLTLFPYTLVFVVLFLVCLKGLKVLSEEDKAFILHLVPRALHGFVKIL